MSKIKNEWPTESREAMLYRRTLAAAARKSALNAVEFEKRGIPYEEVYRCTSRQLARQNAQNFRSHIQDPTDLRNWAGRPSAWRSLSARRSASPWICTSAPI